MQIRRAEISDVKKLRELCIPTFRNAYDWYNTPEDMNLYLETNFSEAQIAKEIAEPHLVFFLAEEGARLIGYVKIGLNEPKLVEAEKPLEILRFYTAVDWIGKGTGKALLEHCRTFALENGYDAIQLGVWQQNEKAIKVYEKWGFRIVGKTTFVLGTDPQDDHVMLLPLKNK